MINKLDALNSLRPTGVWGDTSGKFGCDEGITLPTDAEIDAEVIRLQAVYDSQAYARSRKAEYDQLNQFEMQFDDDRDSTTTWVDKINEIKGRHPK
tara:strand:+ start:148 stop:435 length:288 start_codon:yes stop_codon:yes gene_type:complete